MRNLLWYSLAGARHVNIAVQTSVTYSGALTLSQSVISVICVLDMTCVLASHLCFCSVRHYRSGLLSSASHCSVSCLRVQCSVMVSQCMFLAYQSPDSSWPLDGSSVVCSASHVSHTWLYVPNVGLD